MLLISGATGNLGKEVVSQLLRMGADDSLALLARNPAKAQSFSEQGIEIRVADYDQPETLPHAFAGVDKFLLISTMAMNRAEQQKAVVDAAVKAGVKHIIYTGLAIHDIETSGVRDLMISHFETEDHIKASGIAYTFLRNSMYAEAIPIIVGPLGPDQPIALPGGAGRAPYALRAEMGEAAANVMLQSGHEGKVYRIGASDAWSYADVAKTLSALRGREVAYHDIDAGAYRRTLESTGMPEFMIYLTLGTIEDIKAGQYDIKSNDLETLLGRAPKALTEIVRTVFD